MKIVTLLPGATEIICALGLQTSLAAVSHECDYPLEVINLPKITGSIIPQNLSPDKIDQAVSDAVKENKVLYHIDGKLLSEIKPDLIITQGICDVCAINAGTINETLCTLPEIVSKNTKILSLSGKTFQGILDDILVVAEMTNTINFAMDLINKLKYRWEQLSKNKSNTTPRVLALEWPDPFFYGGHWVPEMIEVAGGIDIMGQMGQDSGRCTFIDIQEKDPDIILFMACGYNLEQNIQFASSFIIDKSFKQLKAVNTDNIWATDANSYFSRPGPRIVDGAEKLSSIFTGHYDNVQGISRILI